MPVEKVLVARPRGFCAGVERSIKAVEKALKIFGAPVYVKHAIVHNQTVVKSLEKKGAVTVETVTEIPTGAVAVFSAHGSPPEDFELARQRKIKVIDATCPLVTKVHFEIISAVKNGYQPIYIGHPRHVEARGVIAEAEKMGVAVPVVENGKEAERLKLAAAADGDKKIISRQKIIVLAQTTFNVNKVKKIIQSLRKRFPNLTEPPQKDICYATTNRQEAVRRLARQSDLVLVVGSKESSNSNRLREVAREEGTEAYLIDNRDDIQENWLEGTKVVGLSAGASAPEFLVQEIIDYFQQQGAAVEELTGLEEDLKFKEPLGLQN